jgi:hypothetical protein
MKTHGGMKLNSTHSEPRNLVELNGQSLNLQRKGHPPYPLDRRLQGIERSCRENFQNSCSKRNPDRTCGVLTVLVGTVIKILFCIRKEARSKPSQITDWLRTFFNFPESFQTDAF